MKDTGELWQCDECGVARPILDDDWICDCPPEKVEEAFNWRRIAFQTIPEGFSDAPGSPEPEKTP